MEEETEAGREDWNDECICVYFNWTLQIYLVFEKHEKRGKSDRAAGSTEIRDVNQSLRILLLVQVKFRLQQRQRVLEKVGKQKPKARSKWEELPQIHTYHSHHNI